jgi:hypothetical protein
MSQVTGTSKLTAIIRTCQILVASLISGVVFFLVLVTLVIPSPIGFARGPAGEGGEAAPAGAVVVPLAILTYLAIGLGLLVLALSFVVPKLNVDQARRKTATATSEKPDLVADTLKMAEIYQTQLIIGEALLDGGAFFAAITYMVNGNPISLLTAIILLAVMATRFPIPHRVRAWIDTQLGRLQDDRLSAV